MSKKPSTLEQPIWKRLPKDKLTGINFSFRGYFDNGVADAMEKRTPPSPSYLKGPANCFLMCYREGYLTTMKILEEEKK